MKEQMFPADAVWLINNMDAFYLALCTPSNKEDEFVLTQNARSMHKGPNSQTIDPTGKVIKECYTEFRLFEPVPPKLMIDCPSKRAATFPTRRCRRRY